MPSGPGAFPSFMILAAYCTCTCTYTYTYTSRVSNLFNPRANFKFKTSWRAALNNLQSLICTNKHYNIKIQNISYINFNATKIKQK
uniref:Putative secreted protein n=1 Tax=Xenopsylla cheopis TaxID=163159 RepID=A0A6M2DYY5_XENCH